MTQKKNSEHHSQNESHSKKKMGGNEIQAYVLMGLSALGAGFSAYLSYHYYALRNGVADFNSVCNISATVNCDVVAASPYAEFIAGIPLSSFSAGWYLMLIILSLYMLYSKAARIEAIRSAFVMSVFGVFMSAFYFWVMSSSLKTFCLFCLLIDMVNVLIFIALLTAKPAHPKKQLIDWSHYKAFAGYFAVSIFLGILLMKGFEPDNVLDARTIKEIGIRYSNTNLTPIPKEISPLTIGPANAPITLVEFSDFQCPHCRIGAKIIKSVMDRYPGKIRLVMMSFPLDNACNTKVTQAMHTKACEAARAALCAEKLGKFEPLYEKIFEHQEELEKGKTPVDFAKEVGISEDTIRTCMGTDEVHRSVQRSLELGESLKVQGTPTFFLNDRRVDGTLPLPAWSYLIDDLLAQKK